MQRSLLIDLATAFAELDRFLFHRLARIHTFFETSSVITDILGDLHRAELGTTHRAEVGDLRTFSGQGSVVILASTLWIETQIELILPAELKARFRECVIA